VKTYTVNQPVRFPDEDQIAANRATHDFYWPWDPDDAGDVRCGRCDCRPSYVSATWPCGADVPREDVTYPIPDDA
jgi:hypothetical protein